MNTFNPSKLSVTLYPPVTAQWPIQDRKYTLTHSDETGHLYLSIGMSFDWSSVNLIMQDEVLAEWIMWHTGESFLYGKVYVSGGEYDKSIAKLRYSIFQKELDLALKAMIYGDKMLYFCFPTLIDAPIYIQFVSNFFELEQLFLYGTPRQYLSKGTDFYDNRGIILKSNNYIM